VLAWGLEKGSSQWIDTDFEAEDKKKVIK